MPFIVTVFFPVAIYGNWSRLSVICNHPGRRCNGTKNEINAGDAVLTGDEASHSIENTGPELLEIMAIILLN